MTDKKQNAQIEQEEQNEQDELRDLSVPEKDAEDVKGGVSGQHFPEVVLTPTAPSKPKSR